MELQHYGIKGMKWGVRRTPEELGHRAGISRKTWNKIQKIHGTLSDSEKAYLGNMMVSFYTTYAKTKRDAYITMDDYGDDYRDEHPYRGKIISIAATKRERGKGTTDSLIQEAIKKHPNSRLVSEIDSDNVASQKLFERNGFVFVEEQDGIRFYVHDPVGSKAVDDYLKKYGKRRF